MRLQIINTEGGHHFFAAEVNGKMCQIDLGPHETKVIETASISPVLTKLQSKGLVALSVLQQEAAAPAVESPASPAPEPPAKEAPEVTPPKSEDSRSSKRKKKPAGGSSDTSSSSE